MDEPTRPAQSTPSAPTATVQTPRVRLARLALDVARATPGVAGTDAGPTGLFFTAAGGERLPGVTCVVGPEGGYDVSLRLVCDLVPLPALAEQVRTAVAAVGARAGIDVESVTIRIVGVVDPEER